MTPETYSVHYTKKPHKLRVDVSIRDKGNDSCTF